MNYQQLAAGKRYHIVTVLEREIPISDITKTIKHHRSSVYRELKKDSKTVPIALQLFKIYQRILARVQDTRHIKRSFIHPLV